MKSVVNERARARCFAMGAVFCSAVVGFVACSGSSERKASRHVSAGGDASEVGGQAGAHQGGSESTAVGEAGLGGQAVAGAGGGGASGGVGAEAGVGGELAQGGQSLAGAGGATVGGEGGGGGAGGEAPFVDPVCGVNMVQVGEYSLWCGKVNMHKDAQGIWVPDADCSSGCNVTGVNYCKKFYPSATSIVTVPQVDVKDWKNAGFVSGQSGACNDSAPDSAGISGQAACCAPL